MTTPEPIQTVLDKLRQALQATTSQLRDVSDAIKVIPTIETYGRRTRHMAWALVLTYIVDIALTLTIVFLLGAQGSQQSALHHDQLQACQLGNDFRAKQRTIWSDLFMVAGTTKHQPNQTPEEYARDQLLLRVFLTEVDKTFASVDCHKLYP